MRIRALIVAYAGLLAVFIAYVYHYQHDVSRIQSVNEDTSPFYGKPDEKYVMVTFQSGMDYWKRCLKGFEDAAEALNVSVEYRGATQYDVNEQVTVLEQVIARKPAGIAVSAINPTALTKTINKAVEEGIPVVLFDSNASGSKAFSFLGTNNYSAGVTAAHEMAKLLKNEGKVAIITSPHQLNHQERTRGFVETIYQKYPRMQVVAVKNGKGDAMASKQAAMEILKDYPDVQGIFATEANGGVGMAEAVKELNKKEIKLISFDTEKQTLDLVKGGVIAATLAQGTWNMGYWSLQFLFHLHHHLTSPSRSGDSPLPTYVDTGITVVTRENVDHFYAK
ncbi:MULTISPECIES: substrate-binding domain-containing protein [Geobacillus]|uniref:Sugar ABC transporter (Sugar-binding protein) n=2 Tax=Geobacillus kaustophilus TaxID=1462 RepID=Q5KYN8_GEOKA|nr:MULTISPECIES: substrate-binding domain-containing protein [Geobacillus]EQB97020.1 LacI family transcriptional regulator [Geobacillus sp. A8]MBW7644097.1 substrate-binding domain-containing protein [Geobacillus thermoleovorans]MDF9297232.1 substrate-binding domain-containing protein [Geobacillus stearothermophilus]ODA17567.1 LacI family transcriptional regulator [Geobacillus thermoleovorans]PJW18337.1 sugar ABC transporter substrate-binding protein [Geobacillus sp. WSUCF-018B]